MKKILVTIVALFLFVGISQAQNKMWLNIGGNLLLPMGDFADVAGVGFGGTAQFEMEFMPQLLGTGTIGYVMWGEKDFGGVIGSQNYSYSSSAIPVLVGAKYYFMPKGGFYGQAQLGLFFFSTSVDVPAYTHGGVTYGGGEVSDSDSEFAFSFGAGYELPLSPKLTLDLSGAFLIISDANNVGIRAGLKFAL